MTAFAMKSLSASLLPSLKHSQLICTSSGRSYLLGQLFGKWQLFSLGNDHRTLLRVPFPIWSYDWVVPAGDSLLMYCLVRRRCILWCLDSGERAPIYGSVPRASGRIQSSFRDGFVHIWLSSSSNTKPQQELLHGKFSLKTEELVSPFEQILDHTPNELMLINDRSLLTWSIKRQQMCTVTLSSTNSRERTSRTNVVGLRTSFKTLKRFVGINRSGAPLLLVHTKNDTRILEYNVGQDAISTLWRDTCRSVKTVMAPDGQILILLSNEQSTNLYLLDPETGQCTHTGSTSLLHPFGNPVVTSANQLIVCDWKRQSIISIDLSSL